MSQKGADTASTVSFMFLPNDPSPFPMTSLFHASIINLVVLQLLPAAFKPADRNEPVQSDLIRHKQAVPSCFRSP
jgi:hypothetical protein